MNPMFVLRHIEICWNAGIHARLFCIETCRRRPARACRTHRPRCRRARDSSGTAIDHVRCVPARCVFLSNVENSAARSKMRFTSSRHWSPLDRCLLCRLRRFATGKCAVSSRGRCSVARPANEARRAGDHFRVTGKKHYTTGSAYADLVRTRQRHDRGHPRALRRLTWNATCRRSESGCIEPQIWHLMHGAFDRRSGTEEDLALNSSLISCR